MRIGLVGLPNSGKTTVFNALTRGDIATTSYSSTTLDVHTAIVDIPDKRFNVIVELYAPKKVTPAKVEYSDIGGLRNDMEQGVSISGEHLGLIGTNDALIHVVRAFEDENIAHPLKTINPQRDIERLDTEFLLSDLSKIENRMVKLESNLKRGKVLPTYESDKEEFDILSTIRHHLEANTPIRDLDLTEQEKKQLRGFQFLSSKPIMILLNLGDEDDFDVANITYSHKHSTIAKICGRLEMDIVNLNEEDMAMFMEEYNITELSLNRIIKQSYLLLNQMTFFTVGRREVRAWEAPLNAMAAICAGIIHSDMKRGFIRTEVFNYQDVLKAGSIKNARAQGKYHVEGKTYLVQDGDILLIRFNV